MVSALCGLIVLATFGAYCNSLGGPFVFDDLESIPRNPTIRQLWPPWEALSPPTTGITVSGRPIFNLSLAVNYAMGGTGVRGYHLLNIAIHALAALLLFGVVRRTLLLPSMRGRFGGAATYLAFAAAILWAVHPLQTESVTYLAQRAESLMGLFYLLTLYCVIRSSDGLAVAWSLAAVASCAAGMATKEVMVTAPVVALLYDRTFLAGSFAAALRKRWGLYAGLAACWGLLAALMAPVGSRGGTVGLGASEVGGWWAYVCAEFTAIAHYLRLSLWPGPLCLDYGISTARPLADVLCGAAVVALLCLATVLGLRRGAKWGFLGAWFLIILAPTSSVIPVRDPVFEHRMYLSLAAVATAAALGGFLLWGKALQLRSWLRNRPPATRRAAPGAILAAVTVTLAVLTIIRNDDYRSPLAIWQDTADKCPSNARASTTWASPYAKDHRWHGA